MKATKLEHELRRLAAMSRDDLVDRWQAIYGCRRPAGARKELLLHAAGWHLQAKRLGGFKGEVRRMLRREIERIKRECQPVESTASGAGDNDSYLPLVAEEALAVVVGREPVDHRVERRKLVPGARLLRDWNGTTHAVDVTGDGYLYNEVTYRSLSAIARRITGAHWSGPRFFGL